MVNHLGPGSENQELQRLWAAIRTIAKATLQNSSIGRAGLRIYDGGVLLIEDGGLSVTGTANVSGTLTGSGNLTWTGPSLFQGTVNVTGNSAFGGTLHILGATTIGGLVTLNNDLSLGTGRILAGPVIVDRLGPAGGRIRSTGQLILGDGSGSVYVDGSTTIDGPLGVTGDINATGNVYGDNKFFRIDHPVKAGYTLLHGSLEGPEHGVYYRGVVTFDSDGEAVFELPDYFTALVLSDDIPTVQVTAIGRPFMTGAELVSDGRVTVYGDAGRDAHVTVTAARGSFDVEPETPQSEGIDPSANSALDASSPSDT